MKSHLIRNELPREKSVEETRLPRPRVPDEEDVTSDTSVHGLTCRPAHWPQQTE